MKLISSIKKYFSRNKYLKKQDSEFFNSPTRKVNLKKLDRILREKAAEISLRNKGYNRDKMEIETLREILSDDPDRYTKVEIGVILKSLGNKN